MSRLFVMLVVLGVGASALAQPPPGPPEHVERRTALLADGTPARLVTRWGMDPSASGASIAIGDAAATVLARGATAGAVERGEHVVLVAYEAYGQGAPFRLRAITGTTLGAEITIARPGARTDDVPFAVAIAPVAGRGFAVFFEEVQQDDPTAAHTYLFWVDVDGTHADAGVEIPVPWPIGAAIWNGAGFHLALLYPGGGSGMRLSMVSLSEGGTNQQHPDWSSPAGFVGDVHLVREGAEIHAHYRGGSGGGHWMETDVTAIRGWGGDPGPGRDHGALDPDATLAVDASGGLFRIVSRADGLRSPLAR